MRLTADVLLRAEHFINAYLDRELCLRGYKIPVIENLSVLQDQFDIIDFSDNDVKKLDNFPTMLRLNALLFNNNSISRIGSNFGACLPNLTTLILTSNRIAHLAELDNIAHCSKLEVLSLMDNTIAFKSHYRAYAIYRMPTLKVLDFKKVSQSEKEAASKFFNSQQGKAFAAAVAEEGRLLASMGASGVGASSSSSGSAVAGSSSSSSGNVNNSSISNRPQTLTLTEEQKKLVKKAIEASTTKEEIDFIEQQLKIGSFDFLSKYSTAEKDEKKEEEEAEEEEEEDGQNAGSGNMETSASVAQQA